MNNKEHFKKGLSIALIIFLGLALAITYFFLLYSNASIAEVMDEVFVVLRPFIIGAIIAYILKSTCNGYEKLFFNIFSKKKNSDPKKNEGKANLIAVILTYITWAIVIGGLLFIAGPQIIESITVFIQDVVNNMPMYIETVTNWLVDFKAQYPDVAPYVVYKR